MRKSLTIAAALLLVPAVTQAKTLEELLVEKGVITKAEAQGATSGAASKVYWNKGTRFDFPDNGFSAGFATFLQERYTYTDTDEDSSADSTSSFEVKKARIILSGSALHNEFTYYLQSDFAEGSDKTTALRDAYLTWAACDWADLKMGQYKTMYNRQYNTSDWKTQFPDRSVASDFFTFGRQQGLSTNLATDDGMWKVSAGIFNGDSDGEGENSVGTDTRHTGVVTVRANVMGKMDSLEESDVDYTEEMAMSIGAGYLYADDENDLGAGLEGNETSAINVDANFKYEGLSINAEFYYLDFESDDTTTESVEPLGYYIQAGYFLNPKKLEVAARYSMLECDDGRAGTITPSRVGKCAGNDDVNEATVALNYYWWKHHLKGSLAYVFQNEGVTGPDGDDINTNKWMLQLSSYF